MPTIVPVPPDFADERWLAVVGWEDLYEVSNFGRVRRIGAGRRAQVGRILGQQVSRKGYLVVGLSNRGSMKTLSVHRMVLRAFVGEQPGPEYEGCHNDGVKTHNALENLRWDTKRANQLDSVAHGTHWEANKTHCKKGHEFTPENTRLYKGKRGCRICSRAYNRAWHAAQRETPIAAPDNGGGAD